MYRALARLERRRLEHWPNITTEHQFLKNRRDLQIRTNKQRVGKLLKKILQEAIFIQPMLDRYKFIWTYITLTEFAYRLAVSAFVISDRITSPRSSVLSTTNATIGQPTTHNSMRLSPNFPILKDLGPFHPKATCACK